MLRWVINETAGGPWVRILSGHEAGLVAMLGNGTALFAYVSSRIGIPSDLKTFAFIVGEN